MAQKGYKFRLYPTIEQQVLFERTFGSTRFVWNTLLASSIENYELYKKSPGKVIKPILSGYEFIKQLTILKSKQELSWLYEVSNTALQQKLLDLGYSFSNFFKKKKGYPKFKSKKGYQSFRLTKKDIRFKENKLYLPKCNTAVKVNWSRELPSEPSSCTITKTSSGKYYISFICEYIPEKTSGQGIIGIDAGITDLATLSNGLTIANLRHYVKSQTKLTKLQRELSKKEKGSKNREKARIKLAKHHEKIANQRNDYLHKLTTKLVRENQAIAIEQLMIGNMVKNHKLAKHILDASWGKMRTYLTYKCIASQHCRLILADPYYPSTQLCSCCASIPKEKIKLGVLRWQCKNCGTIHQRDDNASINLEILAKSELHKALTLGDTSLIILAPKYIAY